MARKRGKYLALAVIFFITISMTNAIPQDTNLQIIGFSKKISPTEKHGIFINESEFYKDKKRTYEVGLPSNSFVPQSRKSQDSINYFKSLNLAENYIYAMMQFETLDGDPTKDQMNLLAADNITLSEYHGDHTYYAKAPRIILESKSYDFVRWIGVAENASWKVERNLRNKTFGRNCTGYINLSIEFYQDIKDIPTSNIKIKLIDNLSRNIIFEGREFIHIEVGVTNIYKIASFNFVERISVVEEEQLLREVLPKALKDPLVNIKCTD